MGMFRDEIIPIIISSPQKWKGFKVLCHLSLNLFCVWDFFATTVLLLIITKLLI